MTVKIPWLSILNLKEKVMSKGNEWLYEDMSYLFLNQICKESIRLS